MDRLRLGGSRRLRLEGLKRNWSRVKWPRGLEVEDAAAPPLSPLRSLFSSSFPPSLRPILDLRAWQARRDWTPYFCTHWRWVWLHRLTTTTSWCRHCLPYLVSTRTITWLPTLLAVSFHCYVRVTQYKFIVLCCSLNLNTQTIIWVPSPRSYSKMGKKNESTNKKWVWFTDNVLITFVSLHAVQHQISFHWP